MNTYFPEVKNTIIRPAGRKATNHGRSIFIGFTQPLINLPMAFYVLVLLPLLQGIFRAISGIVTLILSLFISVYFGLVGRLQVLADVDVDYTPVKMASALGSQEDKIKIDDTLKNIGAFI